MLKTFLFGLYNLHEVTFRMVPYMKKLQFMGAFLYLTLNRILFRLAGLVIERCKIINLFNCFLDPYWFLSEFCVEIIAMINHICSCHRKNYSIILELKRIFIYIENHEGWFCIYRNENSSFDIWRGNSSSIIIISSSVETFWGKNPPNSFFPTDDD